MFKYLSPQDLFSYSPSGRVIFKQRKISVNWRYWEHHVSIIVPTQEIF